MDESIRIKCVDCGVIVGFDEKDLDDNRAIYGPVIFCPYCSKRMQ